jgi:hypothetical protein
MLLLLGPGRLDCELLCLYFVNNVAFVLLMKNVTHYYPRVLVMYLNVSIHVKTTSNLRRRVYLSKNIALTKVYVNFQ